MVWNGWLASGEKKYLAVFDFYIVGSQFEVVAKGFAAADVVFHAMAWADQNFTFVGPLRFPACVGVADDGTLQPASAQGGGLVGAAAKQCEKVAANVEHRDQYAADLDFHARAGRKVIQLGNEDSASRKASASGLLFGSHFRGFSPKNWSAFSPRILRRSVSSMS